MHFDLFQSFRLPLPGVRHLCPEGRVPTLPRVRRRRSPEPLPRPPLAPLHEVRQQLRHVRQLLAVPARLPKPARPKGVDEQAVRRGDGGRLRGRADALREGAGAHAGAQVPRRLQVCAKQG